MCTFINLISRNFRQKPWRNSKISQISPFCSYLTNILRETYLKLVSLLCIISENDDFTEICKKVIRKNDKSISQKFFLVKSIPK